MAWEDRIMTQVMDSRKELVVRDCTDVDCPHLFLVSTTLNVAARTVRKPRIAQSCVDFATVRRHGQCSERLKG
jgi:hypothetical protein